MRSPASCRFHTVGSLCVYTTTRDAALLALCKDKLQAVEAQIKVLDGGQLKPWTGA